MSCLRSSLRESVFAAPIVNTHTHIRPCSSIPQPMTARFLFNHSGCMRQYWTSAGALSRAGYRRGETFDDVRSILAALDQVKTTAFYRMLLRGLKLLHSLDFDELDAASFERLDQKLAEAYQDPAWYSIVLKDKSNLAITCQDSRTLEMDRELFAPVARVDEYVMFGRADWRARVIERHGEACASDLKTLVRCLRHDFEEALAGGAVAIKSNDTWSRRISYEHVSEAAAEDALALCNNGEPEENCRKTIGDYMMNRICELCAEHDIPLQIHTGPAGGLDHFVDYGNPLHLNSLLIGHPQTKFVIFHAGGPFWAECRHLAVQIPNVYLDLCGVLGIASLRQVLEDWIEHVPHGKMMWGTDVNFVDEVFAVVLNFRELLTDFLADRVESGYFSQAVAVDFARSVCSENARRVLRWADRKGSNR